MEQAGLWEKQPMKRKERGSKWKSLERTRVEQGKKGVSLAIKPPHAEVPLWMPHSWTVKPSNQHWGDFSTASSGHSLLITTNAWPHCAHWRKRNQGSPEGARNTSTHNIWDCWVTLNHWLNFVVLATKTNYVRIVCHASLATSLWNRVFTEQSLVNNDTFRQEFQKK